MNTKSEFTLIRLDSDIEIDMDWIIEILKQSDSDYRKSLMKLSHIYEREIWITCNNLRLKLKEVSFDKNEKHFKIITCCAGHRD